MARILRRIPSQALAHGYDETLTIERNDVNGHYCPENCRWATWKEQARNKRCTVRLSAFGKTRAIIEWVEMYGVSKHAILRRIQVLGMTPEEALLLGTGM